VQTIAPRSGHGQRNIFISPKVFILLIDRLTLAGISQNDEMSVSIFLNRTFLHLKGFKTRRRIYCLPMDRAGRLIHCDEIALTDIFCRPTWSLPIRADRDLGLKLSDRFVVGANHRNRLIDFA
jgi:hypothetical protein